MNLPHLPQLYGRGMVAKLGLPAAVATGVFVLVGVSASGSEAPSKSQRAAEVVHRVFPEAVAQLAAVNSQDQGSYQANSDAFNVPPPAYRLAVRLPASETGETRQVSSEAQQMHSAELYWRASLAAGVLATNDESLVGIDLYEFDGSEISTGPVDDFHIDLRGGGAGTPGIWETVPTVGSISERDAEAQLATNIATLRAVAPWFSERGIGYELLSVDPAVNAFAFRVEIEACVSSETIRSSLGDVVIGLTAGLTSSPNPRIDGMAVVASCDGVPVFASFQAPRAGTGDLLLDPAIGPLDSRVSASDAFRSSADGSRPSTMAPGYG